MTIVEKDTSGIYEAAPGEHEMVGARTRRFKKFSLGNGKYRVGGGVTPIHYPPDPFAERPLYKEIDLDLVETPGESWDYACEDNGYQIRIWNTRNIAGNDRYCIAQFRRAGKWFGMAPIRLIWENDAGDKEVISDATGGTPEIDNDANTITWPDCFGSGLHFRYNLRPDQFFKTVIVDDKTDLPMPTIGGPGLKLTVVIALAWDNGIEAGNDFAANQDVSDLDADDQSDPDEELVNPDGFNFRDLIYRDILHVRKPIAWDSSDDREIVSLDWSLQRRGNRVITRLSIRAALLNNPNVVYPVFIDTDISEEQVGASSDDARYDGGWDGGTRWSITRVNGSVGDSTAARYDFEAAMRFTTVPIPAGATIDSSNVKVYAKGANGLPADTRWYGEAADDAATYSTEGDYTGRTKTSASVAYDPDTFNADTWYTITITAITAEICARGGWASSNALALMCVDDQGAGYQAAKNITIYSYDDTPALAPKFNATYSLDDYTDRLNNRIAWKSQADTRHPTFSVFVEQHGDITDIVQNYSFKRTLVGGTNMIAEPNYGTGTIQIYDEDGDYMENGRSLFRRGKKIFIFRGFDDDNIPGFSGVIRSVSIQTDNKTQTLEIADYGYRYRTAKTGGDLSSYTTPVLLINYLESLIRSGDIVYENESGRPTNLTFGDTTLENRTYWAFVHGCCLILGYRQYFDKSGILQLKDRNSVDYSEYVFTDSEIEYMRYLRPVDIINHRFVGVTIGLTLPFLCGVFKVGSGSSSQTHSLSKRKYGEFQNSETDELIGTVQNAQQVVRQDLEYCAFPRDLFSMKTPALPQLELTESIFVNYDAQNISGFFEIVEIGEYASPGILENTFTLMNKEERF